MSAHCFPAPLLSGSGSSLRCSSALRSDRSLILDAAFRSAAMMARLTANRHGRVVVPGLHLRTRPCLSQNPFGSLLPALPGFCSRQSSISASRPLSCPIRERPDSLRAAAPLQDLSILRAPSTRPGSNRRNLPLWVARSAFAPRRRCDNELAQNDGSTLRLRYFPLGSLSFEPLGTSPIMLPHIFPVKQKNKLSSVHFSFRNSWLRGFAGGSSVDKTQM